MMMGFVNWAIRILMKPPEWQRVAAWGRGMAVGLLLLGFGVGGTLPALAVEPDTPEVTPISDLSDGLSHPFVIRETYQAKPQDSVQPASSPGIVGLDMQIRAGKYPLVQGVFRGTPAERQGVQTGDWILAVNGQSTLGESAEAVDAMISDVPGDVVTLKLRRRQAVRTVRLTVMAWTSASPELRQDYGFWGPTR